jgi:hypothetical protein
MVNKLTANGYQLVAKTNPYYQKPSAHHFGIGFFLFVLKITQWGIIFSSLSVNSWVNSDKYDIQMLFSIQRLLSPAMCIAGTPGGCIYLPAFFLLLFKVCYTN